jgi:hypothetical protein
MRTINWEVNIHIYFIFTAYAMDENHNCKYAGTSVKIIFYQGWIGKYRQIVYIISDIYLQ